MLKFYDVDPDYADYLRQFESKVPYIKYDGKNKFVCGIVLNINSCDYYVPVSSKTIKQQNDIIIRDSNNNAISSLRFGFMFPAPIEVLTEKQISVIRQNDPAYASLLQKEYEFCRSHESEIMVKARKVYKIGCNPKHYLHQYCCDFRLLEEKRKLYLSN